MRTLLILNTIHRFGCRRIAETYRDQLLSLGHKATIVHLPGDREREAFYPVPLSKKSYDLIIAFEYVPPRRWTESGHVIWVPMGELTYKHHFDDLWSWLRVVWHNHDAYELAKKQYPWLDSRFLQFGITMPPNIRTPRDSTQPLRVLLQHRLRSFELNPLLEKLQASCKQKLLIRVTDEHRKAEGLRTDLITEYIPGKLTHAQTLELLQNTDVYISPRTQEGAGLLLHEAALLGCWVMGPNASTFNHTFPSQDEHLLLVENDPVATEARNVFLPVVRYDGGITKMITDILSSLTYEECHRRAQQVQQDALQCCEQFQQNFPSQVLDGLTPRTVSAQGWNYRSQGLIINFWRGGGQGLFEAHANRGLEKLVSWSWIQAGTFCSWVTKEPARIGQIMSKGRTRSLGIGTELNELKLNLMIVHWSSALRAEARAGLDDTLNGQADFLENLVRSKKVPTIVIVHEVKPEAWPSDWDPDLVIFPTHHARQKFTQQVYLRSTEVLPHFLDPDLTPGKNMIAGFTFLVLGRLVSSKFDLSYYLALKPCFEQARLLIVGEIDPTIKEALISNQISFEQRVAFSPADKNEVLSSSHVLLHFSPSYESFCLSALEAISFSCPVVTNRPELLEVVGAAGLLVQSGAEAQQVCKELLKQPELYVSLAEKAQEQAQRFPNLNGWLEQMAEFITRATRVPRRACVVIPATTEQGYLVRAVESAVHQSSVLLVCNAPDTETQEVIDQLLNQYPKIRFVKLEVRHQLSQLYSVILPHVVEDVIVFLDGDDELMPSAVAELSQGFEQDEQISLVYADCHAYDCSHEGECEVELNLSCDHEGRMLDLMESGKNVIGHPIAVARWALQLVRVDETLCASAQKDLALKLARIGKVVYIPRKLYRYWWKRPGSVSASQSQLQIDTLARILRANRLQASQQHL